MTDKDKQDISPESTEASERREEASAPDMSDVTLTEADLKVDEPESSSTTASRTDPTTEAIASNPQQDSTQTDTPPSMKVSQTGGPETTEPDNRDKTKKGPKSNNTETADGDADKWAHLSAQEAKLLEYLKKHFGDGITSAPRLTKEYLHETARNYGVKEALIPSISFNRQYGLSAGTKLVFTNKDKNSGSSFTLKKERDDSISSVFTGDRKNFANYVDAWSKNLLIAQRGPMTVTLTSGTAEEKLLMKLALEAQSKSGLEITIEGFDESSLDAEQKQQIKQKWELARGSTQSAHTGAENKTERPTRKARAADTSSVDAKEDVSLASQQPPTHTSPVQPDVVVQKVTEAASPSDFENGKNVVYTDEASLNGETSAKEKEQPKRKPMPKLADAVYERMVDTARQTSVISREALMENFGVRANIADQALRRMTKDGIIGLVVKDFAGAGATPKKNASMIWTSKDHDYPVKFVRMEEERGPDGRAYARVLYDGKETPVPYDELKPVKRKIASAPGKAKDRKPEMA